MSQVTIMSITSIIGGVIGYFLGLAVLSPGVLIPIGVVVGIAVGLAISQKTKKDA